MTLIENPDLKIVPASGVESVEDYAEVDAGTSAREMTSANIAKKMQILLYM
jgi:hypothetical protein